MTDYKNLKLIASSSPHIRSVENTRSIMLDVIIAMLPALFWAIYNFGFKALLSVVVSVVACLFWEWLYRKLLKKPQSIGDLSAVVTGMLLAFVCPPELPWWALVIGAFFSIVVVKQLYGGIGCNFLNPALAGRAILLASYATAMTTWTLPSSKLDTVVSTATPLAIMKEGTVEKFTELTANYSVADMFIGRVGGSLGEVSALALLLGGAWLLIRKVISWHTPVAFIATGAVLIAGLLERFTSLRVDGWMGLGVAAFILVSGWNLARETISPLLGENADEELRQKIVDYIASQPRVLGYHDLMVHDYGPGQRFASLHVEMDKNEDPISCHELIDDMERECLQSHNVHLVIHYDPVVTDDPELDRLREVVKSLLAIKDPRLTIHDFRMVPGEGHTNLIFDVTLPLELRGQEAEIRAALEQALNALDGRRYCCVITFDMAAAN